MLAVFLVSAGVFSWDATAQEDTKEEKERAKRVEEEYAAQKKAIADQKKSQEEFQKLMEQSKDEMEKASFEALEEFENAQKSKDMVRVYRMPGERMYFNGEPFSFTPSGEGQFSWTHMGDNERTTWDLSRSVKEKSFSRNYSFDVEADAKNVTMSVNGDCKAGEIRIKIIMPGGKVYSDILIDEFGNLNWRKTFTITEEENRDKAGEWKFQINASKATGYFKISLQSF